MLCKLSTQLRNSRLISGFAPSRRTCPQTTSRSVVTSSTSAEATSISFRALATCTRTHVDTANTRASGIAPSSRSRPNARIARERSTKIEMYADKQAEWMVKTRAPLVLTPSKGGAIINPRYASAATRAWSMSSTVSPTSGIPSTSPETRYSSPTRANNSEQTRDPNTRIERNASNTNHATAVLCANALSPKRVIATNTVTKNRTEAETAYAPKCDGSTPGTGKVSAVIAIAAEGATTSRKFPAFTPNLPSLVTGSGRRLLSTRDTEISRAIPARPSGHASRQDSSSDTT